METELAEPPDSNTDEMEAEEMKPDAKGSDGKESSTDNAAAALK